MGEDKSSCAILSSFQLVLRDQTYWDDSRINEINTPLITLIYNHDPNPIISLDLVQRPHSLFSLKVNATQNAGTCAFTVSIRTSCSSTRYTRDRISLSFGDAYGNQVYAPRLDDPHSKTFERCSTDTFQVNGPCTYQICYLYLYRSGHDGWLPYDVTVQGYNTNPVTFYYNVIIPSDIWYGFNNCYRSRRAPALVSVE